ncbi:MAG: four helix bundle protein, partial [Bacteroidia bacterium]
MLKVPGRFTSKDRRNFFIIARSSLFECVAIVDSIFDERLYSNEQYDEIINSADEISRILYTMIKNF